ncbi:MAG TPA: DNA-binding response regulator [Pseudomonas sp.]|uniref:response regulator n=1 Tax=Pseudomonas sp. TaxID=306 RepID=UPI000ED1D7CB|nr:response regulator [Pseudomonas sp.]HCS08223.1 DNA-binding response regulator [Pseudomonas sp.]
MSDLLLIDDDQELCELLTSWLSQEGFHVRACHDGLSARKALSESSPDAVVLDVMLPDGSGLELLKQLRNDHPDLPVLMLSARGEPLDRILGLELGADDYLAKPFAFAELLARVRTLLRRGQATPLAERIVVADLVVDTLRRRVERNGQRITLSPKEYTLLELLARRRGEVLPRSLIASQVWDMNFDSDTNVIDVAIRRLRAKIDDDFVDKLIVTVRGMGYVLEAPEDATARNA